LVSGVVGVAGCTKRRCDLSRGIVTTANTVTFHLTAPDPDFLDKLALPPAYAVPAGTPLKAKLPLPATGPYMISSFDAKRGATFVRNPRFREWSADAQPDGYPDRIQFKFAQDTNQTDAQSIKAVEQNKADFTYIYTSVSDKLRRQGYGNQLHNDPQPHTT
jgi:peptide/nickel transport system substrate-binding protein